MRFPAWSVTVLQARVYTGVYTRAGKACTSAECFTNPRSGGSSVMRATAEQNSSSLDIRLFGALDVRVDGKPLPPLRTRKVGYLLAILVLHPEQEIHRDWLAERLWPESIESQAFYNLRQA